MEVDYVIVGAGSAGCVLANRLSAAADRRTLVVEAGGTDRSLWISMPIGYGRLFHDPRVNWCYRTAPDSGLAERRGYWPRGRVLGGSSSINALVSIRGRAADYEDWAAATEDAGWGPEAMARAFRVLDDNDRGADAWRGVGGPLPAHSIDADAHPLTHRFLRACREVGIPPNRDFNGETQEGAGCYQINTRGGRRVSAAAAFLRPAMRRPNLKVMTETRAVALTFEGQRCTGVLLEQGGHRHQVRARRDVILAAGAIESPKLLQLSGIGDAALLARLDIPLRVANANVGTNLQDHFGLNYYYRARVPTLNQELSPPLRRFWHGLRYLLARRGPLSMSVNQGGAFVRTSPARSLPNMQLYLQLITTLEARNLSRPLLAPDPYPAFALGLSNVRPESRGKIAIESTDPSVPPRIEANTYAAAADLEEMLEAVKFLRTLAATQAMAPVVDSEILPGPTVTGDAALIDDIRERTGTVFHPSCTCAMGADPATSVLDADLRVWGTEGLRVVDASSFPNIVSGNLNLPVMMLATCAADRILADRS